MQMGIDTPTALSALTFVASVFGAYMSARSRAEVAEVKLWAKSELEKYRLKEDCQREMDTHAEEIAEARRHFARWQPGTHPPTDKR